MSSEIYFLGSAQPKYNPSYCTKARSLHRHYEIRTDQASLAWGFVLLYLQQLRRHGTLPPITERAKAYRHAI